MQLATKSLYVGNLPYSTTEEDLRRVFDAYGPVEDVRVIQNKGFGFVDVPEDQLGAAIEGTNGTELGGRTITVNEAKPREERPSRPRGGFGGERGGDRGGRGGFGGDRRNDW